MKKILLAGVTGYLGRYIANELKNREYPVRVIARDLQKLDRLHIKSDEALKAEVTEPESLTNCCDKIDVVISTHWHLYLKNLPNQLDFHIT